MRKSFEDMAQRTDNAYREFARSIRETITCTEAEALEITRWYLKAKAAKLDVHIGRITVMHGSFWDARCLRNVLRHIRETRPQAA